MISRRSGFIFCANFAQKISLIHHIHRWRTKRNSTAEKSQDINNDTELYLWSCANQERLKNPPGAKGSTSISLSLGMARPGVLIAHLHDVTHTRPDR